MSRGSRARRARSSPWLPTCGPAPGTASCSCAGRLPAVTRWARRGWCRSPSPRSGRGRESPWPRSGPAALLRTTSGWRCSPPGRAPRRARPAVGLFDVRGRAAVTRAAGRHPLGHPLARVGAPAWCRRDPTAGRAVDADAAPGRRRPRARCARRRSRTSCALVSAHPSTCSSPSSGCWASPVARCWRRRAEGAAEVEPSVRGVMAFDRLMAEEAGTPRRPDGGGGAQARGWGTTMSASVVVLDYGSGNVRSAVRALEHVGAQVTLTSRRGGCPRCRRPLRPGRRQLPRLHGRPRRRRRAAAHRLRASPADGPCSGVCVGMQVMFEGSTEPSERPLGRRRGVAGHRVEARRAGRAAHGLVDRRGACRHRSVRGNRPTSVSTSCTPMPRTPGTLPAGDGAFAAVRAAGDVGLPR